MNRGQGGNNNLDSLKDRPQPQDIQEKVKGQRQEKT